MKTKLILKNILTSGLTRLIIMLLGIVMPRLLITSFGSEVNGMLATITQIFTYLALLQAGIGTSTVNALYAPLSKNNHEQANEVVTEARRYYRKVSLVYGACILVFAVVYPFLANTDLDKNLIFTIILLEGLASFLSYYFCAVYNQILTADGRGYVLENLYFFSYVLQTSGKIVLISLGFDVIAVQVLALASTIVRIPILKLYARKKYPWLSFNTPPTKRYLKERKAFVVHEFSTIIFHNTDVFVISTFCGFAMASVYTIYNTIYSSLSNLLNTANSRLGFVFGQNLEKDSKELCRIYDVYNSLYTAACFVLFTVAAVLTRPFIALYTRGVNDITYLLPGLTLLFVASNLLSGVRAIGSRLITVSGHADRTKVRSLIEAAINLSASIVLVYFFDIYGVLLGTIVALLYRSNDIIIYANKRILNRSPLHDYVGIIINIAVAIGISWLVDVCRPSMDSYVALILWAVLLTVVCCFAYLLVAVLVNVDAFRPYLHTVRRKILKKY